MEAELELVLQELQKMKLRRYEEKHNTGTITM